MKRLLGISVAALLVAAPAHAQKTPDLRQGMSYLKARKMLLQAGWQANVTNVMHKESLQQALQEWFIKRGFSEVDSCMPTGLGLCTAVFVNARGQKLYVQTSEPGDPSPNLVGWCLNKPDCRAN